MAPQEQLSRDTPGGNHGASGLTRRRFIGLSGAAALSIGGIGNLLAAGCGGSSSEEVEDKGKVVVLSWGDPQLASLIGKAFKKETRIELVMVPGANDNDFYNKVSLGGPLRTRAPPATPWRH
jgi:hypothetical protein